MREFVTRLQLEEFYASGGMIRVWTRVQPLITRLRSFMSGVSRQEQSVVWDQASQDLQALSTLLGDKQYFHGDSPTTIDCMIFGHLAQFLYIDIGFPQKTYLESHCQNLIDLVTRMKTTYWQDWEQTIIQSKTIIEMEREEARKNK